MGFPGEGRRARRGATARSTRAAKPLAASPASSARADPQSRLLGGAAAGSRGSARRPDGVARLGARRPDRVTDERRRSAMRTGPAVLAVESAPVVCWSIADRIEPTMRARRPARRPPRGRSGACAAVPSPAGRRRSTAASRCGGGGQDGSGRQPGGGVKSRSSPSPPAAAGACRPRCAACARRQVCLRRSRWCRSRQSPHRVRTGR